MQIIPQLRRAASRVKDWISNDSQKKTALDEFDKSVTIVFGHATHADEEVAKRIHKNKIWVDVNLSSTLKVTPTI
jgi:hypothetical protein